MINSVLKTPEISYTTLGWDATSEQNLKHWDPGFDAERSLVYTKLGPYRRLFPKPDKFTKRFYHTLYLLPIEHWDVSERLALYDGFCTIEAELTIRFQATYNYVRKNNLLQDDINTYIKSFYLALILDIVQEELLKLIDGAWVQTGLGAQENEIAMAVNELLLAHDIQAQTLCQLNPEFKSFPDIKFKEDAIYLMALKKNFEIVNQKQQEQFLQEQLMETQRLQQKQQRMQLLQQDKDLDLQQQVQQAEYEKKLLLEQEAQQAEKFAIEKRLHAQKVKQETELHALTLQENIRRQEQKEVLQRQLELKTLAEKLTHQLTIKEQELLTKIKASEQEKVHWNNAKAKWQVEEIKYKQRQQQMEIDAELENKAYLYEKQQRLQEQFKVK